MNDTIKESGMIDTAKTAKTDHRTGITTETLGDDPYGEDFRLTATLNLDNLVAIAEMLNDHYRWGATVKVNGREAHTGWNRGVVKPFDTYQTGSLSMKVAAKAGGGKTNTIYFKQGAAIDATVLVK